MDKRSISLLLAALLILTPAVVPAAWSSSPHLNNPICTAAADQWFVGICSDGSGGYLIAWGDERDSRNPHDIYMQNIDADGDPLWGADGLRVYDSVDTSQDVQMCSDGAGGAYLAILDRIGGTHYTLVMQYVAAGGSTPWGLQGMVATPGADDHVQFDPALAADGYGGAYVVWSDLRSSAISGMDLWAQRVNAAGPTWGPIGVNINNRPGDQYATAMVPCPGGVVLAWQDERDLATYAIDIYAQRFDGGGTRQWTFTGVPVSAHPDHQREPVIASDGAGGAFIAWLDYRDLPTSNVDIFAQHLDQYGVRQGVVNGTAVCTDDAGLDRVEIVFDGSSGAYVTWVDHRDDGFDGVTLYAQHIGNTAHPVWNTAGVLVCAMDGSQGGSGYAVGTAGNGDLLLVWSDQRTGVYDLYAQRLTSMAALQWPAQGLLVSDAPDYQWPPGIVVETDGTCVAAWMDSRPEVDDDIYAQRIDGQGILGYPMSSVTEPRLPDVVDLRPNVPNPFNPLTTISYELPSTESVHLRVFDVSGRLVRVLLDGETVDEGLHHAVWNGRDGSGHQVAAGMYFYRLEAGGYSETKRMVLVK